MGNSNSIPIKNIYYMLAYAFQCLNVSEAKIYSKESFEFIGDLFAEILCNGVVKQLKAGLEKDYIPLEEELSTPRGKIGISETMRNYTRGSHTVYCEVDEYIENTLTNQILKVVLLVLMKSNDVEKARRERIKRILQHFSHVDEIDPIIIRWNTLQYHRNNQAYRMLMNICYLVLEGMIMSDTNGEPLKFKSFVDDIKMHKLFEKFLLEFYKKHYSRGKFRIAASKINWIVDEEDPWISLLPEMRTDITIEDKNNHKVLIIDAKFYSRTLQYNSIYENESLHSGNIYQVFTYVKNRDIKHDGSVSGMLLYAKTEHEPSRDFSCVVDGNRIFMRTLDLNCDFSEIQKQLFSIIDNWQDLVRK